MSFRQALLESDVLALGRIEPLPGSADACLEAQAQKEDDRDMFMVLDSAALENLEVSRLIPRALVRNEMERSRSSANSIQYAIKQFDLVA